jgi:uncharacterized protein YbjT (DUF2867 family)
VVAVTCNPAVAELPGGAHVMGGDPSHPQALTSALRGVKAVLISPSALGDATAGAATAELLALAVEQSVERVVALSAVTVQYAAGYRRFADAFKALEDAIKASGLLWTFLRSADYAANTVAWAPQMRSANIVRGAYGDAATSTIHERAVAVIAARALVNSAYAGHSYVLTGPQSLTQRDKGRLIGEAIGKELSFEEPPPEQLRQAILAQGLPEDVPDRLLGSLADYAKQPGPSSGTVEQVLGRPALTFAEWAAEHAAAFRNRRERNGNYERLTAGDDRLVSTHYQGATDETHDLRSDRWYRSASPRAGRRRRARCNRSRTAPEEAVHTGTHSHGRSGDSGRGGARVRSRRSRRGALRPWSKIEF